jgi:hypothetical protein
LKGISACIAMLLGGLAGCSSTVDPPAPDSAPVVSAYAHRVPGKWALLVDTTKANVAIQESGTRCSSVDDPVDLSRSFARTAEATFKSVADDIRLSDHSLSQNEIASGAYTGVVVLRVTDLHATLKTDGLLDTHAVAETEIGGTILVTKGSERMVDASELGKGGAERDAGLTCEGAATAASAASDAAVEDVVRRLAEQFANSRAVRDAAPGLSPP